jgi:hypothetical protein
LKTPKRGGTFHINPFNLFIFSNGSSNIFLILLIKILNGIMGRKMKKCLT